MRPKVIKTDQGEFEVLPWSGFNSSGYEPEGDRVLVLPDQCSAQTSGGIVLPEEIVERIGAAAVTGVLVASGVDAFVWSSDRSRRRESRPPAPGDRVYFEKYSGGILNGDDGKIYRVIDDKAIGAVHRGISIFTPEILAAAQIKPASTEETKERA